MTQKWQTNQDVNVRKGHSFIFYFENDEIKICWGTGKGYMSCDETNPINFAWGFSLGTD